MSDSVNIVKIDLNHAGQRLDNFLIKQLKGVPKSHIYRIVRKGEVRINKKRCKVQQRLEQGDEVRIPPIRVSHKTTAEPGAGARELMLQSILFEDEHLLILNKPAGWAVHSGSGNEFGVIETLKFAKPHTPFLELVHRLDKDTSGCLMIAKSRQVLTTLQQILRVHNNGIKKTYLALLKGKWLDGVRTIQVNLSVSKDSENFKSSRVDDQGKSASSEFKPSKVFTDSSLMKVEISTGRMHQIRVHAAHLNHPVIGDKKYGDFEFNREFRKEYGLNRIFLHASKLSFKHPVTRQKLSFFSPLPEELKRVLIQVEDECTN